MLPLLAAGTLLHMLAQPSSEELSDAFAALTSFAAPGMLTLRIGDLERQLVRRTREQALTDLGAEDVTPTLLQAALSVKQMAGQINVIVHAVGILVSLAYVLEPGERIERLSLGAGNTGRLHDLETDRQIGEFKFIEWRGGGRVHSTEQPIRRPLQSRHSTDIEASRALRRRKGDADAVLA